MKAKTILLLIFLCSVGTYAQSKKFTITTKGGQSYAVNKYSKSTKYLKFKIDGNKVELPYRALDSIISHKGSNFIKSREPAVYKFIPISNTRGALMEILERGKCTLYVWRYASGGGSSTNFYTYREGEGVPKILVTRDFLSPLNFIDDTSEYFKDCPALVDKIQNKDYKKKETQEMVRFYNAVCGE